MAANLPFEGRTWVHSLCLSLRYAFCSFSSLRFFLFPLHFFPLILIVLPFPFFFSILSTAFIFSYNLIPLISSFLFSCILICYLLFISLRLLYFPPSFILSIISFIFCFLDFSLLLLCLIFLHFSVLLLLHFSV